MSELAILVPVLRRPHRVKPLLESIRETTPDAWVEFICSPDDDEEIHEIEDAIREYGERFLDYTLCDGNYAAKINHGVRAAWPVGHPLFLLAADDLHFHPGWLEAARRRLRGKVQVVATNDLCNPRTQAGRLATHPLIVREYAERGTIDEPGKLLHEGYAHEYCDQELTETAISRGAFDYAADAVIEHLHPDAGKAPMDELYAARPARMRQGRRLYRAREHLWS